MHNPPYVAVDLGAESGRVVAGTLDEGRIHLEELHRFPNIPVHTPDGLHWDVLRLFQEIQVGLRAAARAHPEGLAGIGVDSWGVDYGLLDAAGRLLGNPYHYRDSRSLGLKEEAAARVSPQEQYARTGIAQMPINTIYQLMAPRRSDDRSPELAASLLMIPDLLHYWLTGEKASEYTNATTTGALGVDGVWARDLLDRLDVPSRMLLDVTQPGAILGPLRASVREECGLGAVPVILPATHDTAGAVVAVPWEPHAAGRRAYISSGTWSLLGLELEHPILSGEARLAGFTNEGGICGTFRFLTNISGLWLLQECRRVWARQGMTWGYEELTNLAAAAQSPRVVIEVDDPTFLHPADMPAAINEQLGRSGQPQLEDPVAMTRAIVEGLALKYRLALERAEHLNGAAVDAVHITGGGVRNHLLCQFTADACRKPVLAGPAEGTALGNVLVQAMGRGEVASLREAHQIARASVDVQVYQPRPEGWWDEAYGRLPAPQQK